MRSTNRVANLGQEKQPRFSDLVEPATGARLGFQVSENYQRPDWPDHRRVLTQGRLDIGVLTGDYDRVSDFAVSLGRMRDQCRGAR